MAIIAASSIDFPKTPTLSNDLDSSNTPSREIFPGVGINPTTPHHAAGRRTDPPVSVPKEPKQSWAATEAALPPDEPPVHLFKSQGFFAGRKAESRDGPPKQNSVVSFLPIIIEPASNNLETTLEFVEAKLSKSTLEPTVVGTPTISNASFNAIGKPWRTPLYLPSSLSESKNLVPVIGLKKTHSKILECDFIVARGGYNTISECLVLKKPSILYDERNNPEIYYNLKTVNNLQLCDLLKTKNWKKNFKTKINKFLKYEFKNIEKKFRFKKFKNTGSIEIVNDILKVIKKKWLVNLKKEYI